MKARRHLRTSIVLLAGVLLLVAVHGLALHYAASRVTLPTALAAA